MRQFLLCAVVVMCGCGSAPNVGGSCTDNGDCDEDLSCNTSVPGGYCTASCSTSGSTSECPEDSVCDTVAGAALSCVKLCKTSDDCRSDLDCNGVSGTNVKACKPKE